MSTCFTILTEYYQFTLPILNIKRVLVERNKKYIFFLTINIYSNLRVKYYICSITKSLGK